jgi:hypothetical protein
MKVKIKSIRKVPYKGKVYNMELESNVDTPDDDLFWIEQSTGLVSHNCFPKDVNALISYADELECNIELMKKAWELNLKYRTDNDWLRIPGAVSETEKD